LARQQRLNDAQIAELFDPPTEQRDLVRHYTLSASDLAAINRCRGDHNRLGYALMRCYLRYPGRAMRTDERIPAALLAFVAGGGAGWLAHGVVASPSAFQNFTLDALDAHRLYVVEVRHPVEVPGNERAHLQQWLTKRCGWNVRAPELDATGLKLVGGRLLPGPTGPASFLMYESASGERFTVYTATATTETTQMRYTTQNNEGALFWADRGVGYVVSGGSDRGRLTQIAQAVYDQMEKSGG